MNKQQNTAGNPQNSRWILLFTTEIMFLLSVACAVPSLISRPTPTPTVKPTQRVNLATPPVTNAPVNMNTIGYPGAPVKIDVWEDFQCSACVYYTQNIEPQVLQTYVGTGKVFYTYHFYPFLDGGSPDGESHRAADAAMCAAEQGKFWEYHAVLAANWNGENQHAFRDARLLDFAHVIGLGGDFEQCFTEKRYTDQIQQDIELGKQWGVAGTPSVFVNGILLKPGYVPSFNDISQAVEEALAAVNP